MSQAKVDRYKEQKANRQKIMKKEKREKLLWKLGCYAVLLVLVIWVGYSAFDRFYEAPIRYYDADVTALSDYLSGLSAEEEEETEAQDAAEEETTEAQTAAEEGTTEAQTAAEEGTTEAQTAAEEGATEAQESATEA